MDRAHTADRTAIEQVTAAAEEYLRFYLDYPEYFRMLAFPPDPGRYAAGRDLTNRLAGRVDEQNQRLVDALRRGIAMGVIRSVDPKQTATVTWAAWNGIVSLAWRHDALRRDESGLRELLAAATSLIALGLLPRTGEVRTG